MKNLIILSGLPGSGKSTWGINYQKNNKNVFILSSDEIRYKLTKNHLDFTKQKEVWEIIDKRIKEYQKLKNVTVIVDALNNLNIYRLDYINSYKKFDKYTLVLFDKSLKDIIAYNNKRKKPLKIDNKIIKTLYSNFEDVNKEVIDKYNEIIRIIKYS